jgi:hypothetical protein
MQRAVLFPILFGAAFSMSVPDVLAEEPTKTAVPATTKNIGYLV